VSVLVLPLVTLGTTRADEPTVAFVGVTVIDVAAGKPVPGQTVVVAGGKIAAVGPTATVRVPAGATEVKADGKFLMPGLWDMHTHIADETYCQLFLAGGVTGVREMHAFFPAMILGLRDVVRAGKRLGPRIVAAGALVDGPQPVWPGSIKATTPAEGRDAVRRLKDLKADFVKVYSSLTPEVYQAIVDEAKKQGLPVAGHCPELVPVTEASDAGQRSVEHLMGVSVACSRDEAELRKQLAAAIEGKERLDYAALTRVWDKADDGYDPDKAKARYAKFVQNGTWVCPTTVVFRNIAGLAPAAERDGPIKYMPPIIKTMWKQMAAPPERQAAMKPWYARRQKVGGEMHRAGVPLLAGTDCSNPHTYPGFSLPAELELFVECGLAPAEALRTATLNPAKFFGEEGTAGTVEVGKRADLVLLDADPLEKVGNVRRVAGVVASGRYLPAGELKRMLGEVRRGEVGHPWPKRSRRGTAVEPGTGAGTCRGWCRSSSSACSEPCGSSSATYPRPMPGPKTSARSAASSRGRMSRPEPWAGQPAVGCLGPAGAGAPGTGGRTGHPRTSSGAAVWRSPVRAKGNSPFGTAPELHPRSGPGQAVRYSPVT
jgi:imidazolonepropionase-like amidohydrolase